jgi:hypothetical protein
MRTSEAPTVERLEFAQLCQGIEEFEPLPDHTSAGFVDESQETDEPTQLDELILAGLVSPV